MNTTVHAFSRRLGVDVSPHPLHVLLIAMQDRGEEILDLTVSNPTAAGFRYDHEAVRVAFACHDCLTYAPDPQGSLAVRESIASMYARRSCTVLPGQIHLTASSSEAYSWLFKLLGDPGDILLAPYPAYPLFRDLAALEGLRLRPYVMRYEVDTGWRLDRSSLDAAICDGVRAVLAVHPANPTGAYVHREDMDYLRRFCDEHSVALIVDEVFFDYHLEEDTQAVSALDGDPPRLLFVLDGFSKMLCLPQMKLGWIVTAGSEAAADDARLRLDHIADTYLSVSAPVQAHARELLGTKDGIQAQVRERCRDNLSVLRSALHHTSAYSLLAPEGGWSAVLRIEQGSSDEEAACTLLQERHVLVHPGSMFDFPFAEHLVLSLITPPEVFQEGVHRLLR